MRHVVFFVILLHGTGFSQDRIRDFFEWGEYDSLLAEIDSFFVSHTPDCDSLTGLYRAYAGVGYFAQGNIGEARRHFIAALNCRPALELDLHYITPEMANLFTDAKNEIARTMARALHDDSVRVAREDSLRKAREDSLSIAAEKNAWTLAMRTNASALQKRFVWNAGTGAAFLVISAIAGFLAYKEYRDGKHGEQEFRDAAAMGDKEAYERLKTVLENRNHRITGFSLGCGISGSIALWCGFRGVRVYTMRTKLLGDTWKKGVAFEYDF